MEAKADIGPAIKSIHLLSTGSGEQHKQHRYGSRLPSILWVLTSRSSACSMPAQRKGQAFENFLEIS